MTMSNEIGIMYCVIAASFVFTICLFALLSSRIATLEKENKTRGEVIEEMRRMLNDKESRLIKLRTDVDVEANDIGRIYEEIDVFRKDIEEFNEDMKDYVKSTCKDCRTDCSNLADELRVDCNKMTNSFESAFKLLSNDVDILREKCKDCVKKFVST